MYPMHITWSEDILKCISDGMLGSEDEQGRVTMGMPSSNDSLATPPVMPSSFWQQTDIQLACRSNHFGYLLKAYRELQTPVVKQAQLAAWLGITQGQVSRIERGASNGQDLKKLITWATILQIPQDILWFKLSTSHDEPFTPDCSEPKIETGNEIEGEDVDRRQLLKTAGIGAVLLGTSTDLLTSVQSNTGVSKIGSSDINSLRYWTDVFRNADNKFGGGESLEQARHFVASRVVPMLKDSRATAQVRQELLSSAAQLYQLTGWMSYDVGDPDAGRKCLRQAFQLCDEANNKPLAAEILAGMSHQAAFLRKPDEAVDLALAARRFAVDANQPALIAETAVLEAHGLALQGDTRGCFNALKRAEDHFAQIRRANLPEWLKYFDQAYLSAKFGHTLRDLGRPIDAERFARQSLHMTDGYDRGKTFNLALLAGVLADKGEVDESVTIAGDALTLADSVRSRRTVSYMADVAARLTRFDREPSVRRLYRAMAKRRIPLGQAS
jgi:transcriptional regulator with XRE-family HTH domain